VDGSGDERLSFLGRRLPSPFERRAVRLAPGGTRRFARADWEDALVVVERGAIDLECTDGSVHRFRCGDVLWLADLPLRALHNRGLRTALLVAISRRAASRNPRANDEVVTQQRSRSRSWGADPSRMGVPGTSYVGAVGPPPASNRREPAMTSSSTSTSIVRELGSALSGRVIGPGDGDYDRARTVFSGAIDRRPAAIARVADDADVARTVTFAREAGLELAVRSGGHSSAGHGVSEGGLVIDLRELKGLEIDPEGRTAWVQTGVTAAEYTAATDAHGLGTGFGDTGSVGIGGITLSGGIGFLVRKHGLTIDQLLEAELVTADGELVRVDADSHPDLFWAIRGGGGNFGVATRFRFRLHELGQVAGGMLILPATPEVITSFLAEAEAAPEELSTIANVMPAPPMPFVPEAHHGRLIVFALMVYAGDPETGQRALAPFRALAEPIADLLRPMRYPEIFLPDDEDYRPMAQGRTMFIDSVDQATAETILQRLETSDAPMRVTQLRALGGAMARVPNEATAFAHRHRRVMATAAALYERPEEAEARLAWVQELSNVLQNGEVGTYVGFVGDEGEARVHDAYPGSTFERLAEVKRRYDPTNLFRLNQNVPPAPA
jgi:FAD/FMN-containing dehydrogenase